MVRWIAKAGGLLLALAIVAGCAALTFTGEQSEPERRPAPSVVQQEARLHLHAEPGTLDSTRAADTVAFDLLGNLMEGLVRQGAGGAVLPAVAERWETPDGRHFTFHLRKEARWSDGRPVTANDFVYAWLRALDPQQGSVYAFLLYDIEGAEAWNSLDPADPEFSKRSDELRRQVSVTAVDASTLQVVLRVANPYWVNYTAHPLFYPQPAWSQAGSELVSNGPFVLENWERGVQIILRKNQAYWDAESVRLEKAAFRIERDGRAALRLYQSGELDYVLLPGALAVTQQGVQRMAQPSTMGLTFYVARPPLDSLQVRRAIHLAINRIQLINEAVPLQAVPGEGLIPPALSGEWETVPQVRTPVLGDPFNGREVWNLARKELKAEELTIGLLHTPETEATARVIETMLEGTLPGLQVERESVPFEQRLERARLGQFDMVLQGWAVDHDDPLTLLEQFVTDGPGNDSRWMNGEFDQRIVSARLGNVERQPALAEAERILLEELPVLPLYHPVRYWLTQDRLKGLRVAPLGARLDLKGAFIER